MKKDTKSNNYYLTIIISLIIGFVSGVGFSVYRTPDIISGLPTVKQDSGPSDEEIAKHINHLKEAAEAKKDDPEAWTELAHAYFESNAFQEAIAAYTRVLEITPDNSAIYTDLGVMFRRNKQPEMAVEAFRKAIALDPSNLHAQFNVGIVLFHDLDDKEGAVKAWEKVAENDPDYRLSTGQTIEQLLQSVN